MKGKIRFTVSVDDLSWQKVIALLNFFIPIFWAILYRICII